MTTALQQHLATGTPLIMLSPGSELPPLSLAGADAVFVDREGTGLSFDGATRQIAAARDVGLFSVLRTDGPSPTELTSCLVLRPDALVLPQIADAEQLEEIVRVANGSPPALVAQIETVEAVENLDALIAVRGVTGFLIGPFDLARAMGEQGPDAPAVAGSVADVAKRLHAAGRVFGLPTLTPDAHAHWCARGAQLLYITLPVFLSKEFAPCLSR